MTVVILESTLTCPECGHAKTETMPTDACQWFYECEQCHAVLKPKPGDCCVYCSYGTVPCPPIQERGKGGCCGSKLGQSQPLTRPSWAPQGMGRYGMHRYLLKPVGDWSDKN